MGHTAFGVGLKIGAIAELGITQPLVSGDVVHGLLAMLLLVTGRNGRVIGDCTKGADPLNQSGNRGDSSCTSNHPSAVSPMYCFRLESLDISL
ncbi:hypothetical protein DPMN_007953 [Dreissena polymorpha]|uniref:Uncharacterized protein n=1 Tax=Dreissena polymorpha TaxID=45954 RepID=A0A9D4MUH6_DREPO|nr:hypothetical protein DPMN_007953 [Dreissena polymorpha]